MESPAVPHKPASVLKSHSSSSNADSKLEPAKAAAPAATASAGAPTPTNGGTKERKITFTNVEKSAEEKKAPPPMIDLGIKFNAGKVGFFFRLVVVSLVLSRTDTLFKNPNVFLQADQEKDKSKDKFLSDDTRDMFNRATHRSRTVTQDEFEGEVAAYDFEANYAAASKKGLLYICWSHTQDSRRDKQRTGMGGRWYSKAH